MFDTILKGGKRKSKSSSVHNNYNHYIFLTTSSVACRTNLFTKGRNDTRKQTVGYQMSGLISFLMRLFLYSTLGSYVPCQVFTQRGENGKGSQKLNVAACGRPQISGCVYESHLGFQTDNDRDVHSKEKDNHHILWHIPSTQINIKE